MSLVGRYNITLLSGQTRPPPRLGQVLSEPGVNLIDFFKEFNNRTTSIKANIPLQVKLHSYSDRSYRFYIRSPSSSWFIKRCSKIPILSSSTPSKKESSKVDSKYVGEITLKELYQISDIKKWDPEWIGFPMWNVFKSLQWTAKSSGIAPVEVVSKNQYFRDEIDPDSLDDMKKRLRQSKKSSKKSR